MVIVEDQFHFEFKESSSKVVQIQPKHHSSQLQVIFSTRRTALLINGSHPPLAYVKPIPIVGRLAGQYIVTINTIKKIALKLNKASPEKSPNTWRLTLPNNLEKDWLTWGKALEKEIRFEKENKKWIVYSFGGDLKMILCELDTTNGNFSFCSNCHPTFALIVMFVLGFIAYR